MPHLLARLPLAAGLDQRFHVTGLDQRLLDDAHLVGLVMDGPEAMALRAQGHHAHAVFRASAPGSGAQVVAVDVGRDTNHFWSPLLGLSHSGQHEDFRALTVFQFNLRRESQVAIGLRDNRDPFL